MKTAEKIFLSYAREDEKRVKKLYQKLSYAGYQPWMDIKDLLPGQKWKSVIQKAIRNSNLFLACLSTNSVTKQGFVQVEIKEALEIWNEKPDGDIFLIPVRLEGCLVPDNLRDLHWVDLFDKRGWSRKGWDSLVKSIQRKIKIADGGRTYYPIHEIRKELVSILQSIPDMDDLGVRSFLLRGVSARKWDGLERHDLMRIDLSNIVDKVIEVEELEKLIENAIDFAQSPTLRQELEEILKKYRRDKIFPTKPTISRRGI